MCSACLLCRPYLQHASRVNHIPWAPQVALQGTPLAKQPEASAPKAKGVLAAVLQLHTANDQLVLWDGQCLVGVSKADVMDAVAAEASRKGPCSMGACQESKSGSKAEHGVEVQLVAVATCRM